MAFPHGDWSLPHRNHVRRVQSVAKAFAARGDIDRARALLLTVDPEEFLDADGAARALSVLREARSSDVALVDAIHALLAQLPSAHLVGA